MSLLTKYAPTKLSELVLPANKSDKMLIETLIEKNAFPYSGLLLASPNGGSGKSAAVSVIAENPYWQVFNAKSLQIGIDDLLNLQDIISLVPLFGEKHLVIIEEISESSKNFRLGLRRLMDNYGSNAFFLFTDNNPSKLVSETPQVFDNQRVFNMDYSLLDVNMLQQRVMKIITAEKPEIFADSEKMAEIGKLIKRNRNSIRSIIAGIDIIINQ